MLKVIDNQFNFLGAVDEYSSFIAERSYFKIGEFELHLPFKKDNFDILKEENILFKTADKPYIILNTKINSADQTMIIQGLELKQYISRWLTKPPADTSYHRMNANAETIMKEYVKANCLIPSLEVAPDLKKGRQLVFQTRYKPLDEELEKIGLASGLGWTIRLDLDNKRFIFDVLEGVNRVAGQDANSQAIFSDDFDNVTNQTLTQGKLGYKSVAIVAGQGEGVNRSIVEIGDAEGFDRYEVFIDARDIEEDKDLPDRGRQKLSEFERVQAFESEILAQSNLIYEEDYNIGDTVTIQNKKWNVTVDSIIENITEIYEADGFRLEATFGKALPTLTEMIKKEMDQPVTEGGGGSVGLMNVDGGKAATQYGGIEILRGGDASGN